jgi:putative ABC transport system permease protein
MALPLSYNWRNLTARRFSTGLTFVVVGIVVFVLAILLSFAAGIKRSLVVSGSRQNVIVLKPGCTSESTSILRPEEARQLIQVPGVARAAENDCNVPVGTPLVSDEISIQASLTRAADGSVANVAVRGVDSEAFLVHPDVRLARGCLFQPGAREAIVGEAAWQRFAGLELGDEIRLGRRGNHVYRIVGIFRAGGGALESEIWAPRTRVEDSYFRPYLSSVCLRLADPADAPRAVAYINGPTVGLEGRTETAYYDELARKTRDIVALTVTLVTIMACGAVFAVANTMYGAVDNRRREIAMLRTLGFGRGAIVLAFVLEALFVCAAACACGLGASLLFNGSRQDFLSDATWTVLAYELRITPDIVAAALGLALLVGTVGAAGPALRAARTNILQAVRKG